MLRLDPDLVNAGAAAGSAAAAFLSILIAVYVSRRAESFTIAERERADAAMAAERERTQLAATAERERAEAFAASERSHSSFNTVAEWRRDLRDWANQAIDILSEATYVCGNLDEESAEYRSATFSCRHRLSSIIDRGRFFLPNIRTEEHGVDKPTAYRGYRHAVLDPLVAAERVLSLGDQGAFIDRKHALIAMKREFVSAIQQILDPEHHNQEVARMIRAGNQAVDDDRALRTLNNTDSLPRGAEALLHNPPSTHPGLREDFRQRSSRAR
jgi:hypothetical protein